MSRFKIVKKHGRLEKREVYRHPPWVDWKEKLYKAVSSTPYPYHMRLDEQQVIQAMADDEFVIWALLLMFEDMRRHDSTIDFFVFMHEGRGVRLTMYAGNRFGIVFRQSALYAAHRRLAEWVSLGWEKLVGWQIDISTGMSPGRDPPLSLRITLYPPNSSNFHHICRELWVALGPNAALSVQILSEAVYRRFT
jgi:hypothetical protein